MADLERRETKSFPELLSLCKSRYDQWADELLQPFEADLPPRLVTAEFYEALSRHISPRIKETLVSLDVPIKELVESQPSVSERNSLREKIVRKVIGGDPLEDIKEEKVRRRVRSVTVDLMSALQLQGAEVVALEQALAPRAWHWIKDCDYRDLYDVSKITNFDTDKGDKLASASPRELAYAIQLLGN